MSSEKPNMTAVAERAGVSLATVSRVVNRNARVRPHTAKKVHRAMSELDCTADQIRNGVRKKPFQRSKDIALAVPAEIYNLRNSPLVSEIILTTTQALAGDRHNLKLIPLEKGQQLRPSSAADHYDGLLTYSIRADHEPEQDVGPRVNIMPADCRYLDSDSVIPNNHAVGALAFKRLQAYDCRHLAVMIPTMHKPFKERFDGFRREARLAGLKVNFLFQKHEPRVMHDNLQDLEVADSLVDQFMSLDPRPDGLFIPSDIFTVKVYMSLRNRGLSLGDDLPTVSVDNEQPLLSLIPHQIPTIDLQASQIAKKAVELLLAKLDDDDDKSTTNIVKVQPLLVDNREEVLLR